VGDSVVIREGRDSGRGVGGGELEIAQAQEKKRRNNAVLKRLSAELGGESTN